MSYFAAAICRAGPSVQKCILSKAIIPVGSYETRRGAKKTPRVAKTPEQRKAEQLSKHHSFLVLSKLLNMFNRKERQKTSRA